MSLIKVLTVSGSLRLPSGGFPVRHREGGTRGGAAFSVASGQSLKSGEGWRRCSLSVLSLFTLPDGCVAVLVGRTLQVQLLEGHVVSGQNIAL